jgi:acetyl-CoA carboxylase carboxyl transferase subunit alpha
MKPLSFEAPIQELYEKIATLKELSKEGTTEDGQKIDLSEEIERIEKRAETMKKNIYAKLTPIQVVQIARHPNRPDSSSLFRLILDNYIELHGDRQFRDDPSIVGGLGYLKKQRVMVIGHQKGHGTKENIHRNFGMPHPEGYRKALRLMKLAEKFNIPIITFIDTPGAYPGLGAEERGQAEAIARNLREMTGLKVPVLTIVIGEGGSGGALGIGVSNKVYMLQYAVYSVISPEGCASILFHDASKADFTAKNLKITAKDIVELGIADDIIPEPTGGAHYNWEATAASIKKTLSKDLTTYKKIKNPQKIIEERYQKFRNMGQFIEA